MKKMKTILKDKHLKVVNQLLKTFAIHLFSTLHWYVQSWKQM